MTQTKATCFCQGTVRLKLVGPRTGQVAERLIRGTTRDPPFSVLEGTDPRDLRDEALVANLAKASVSPFFWGGCPRVLGC